MLDYPVRLVPTKHGTVRAVFPDVPQATAEGRDEEDALYRAKFVLEMCLGHMLAHGEAPPEPSHTPDAPTVRTAKVGRTAEAAQF
jgi:predicted RNase H-like HicB family nuclease